jgi:uncharacterized protein with ATP-grasp and redox domains
MIFVPVPPPWYTSERGSFAHTTFAVRVPGILEATRRVLGPVPATVDEAFDELDDEIRHGRLRGLRESAPDRRFWDLACAPNCARTWLDQPWYFAEAFFYRRILECTGYFGSGALALVDPFYRQKQAELGSNQGLGRCVALEDQLGEPARQRLRGLLLASLWGNRVDLSYNVGLALGSFAGSARDLLVDDCEPLMDVVESGACRSVAIIGDNAGTELMMDLRLCDHLLERTPVERVRLYVKSHPTFVSDAILADVDAAIGALAGVDKSAIAELAARLRAALEHRRLTVVAHPFFTTSLFFTDFPPDLAAELRRADLSLIKGDANYRRLCSDAHWAPETPFADVVRYFGARIVALRTMKAEVVVGLRPGEAAQLTRQDPTWMVDGRRGVIQACLE